MNHWHCSRCMRLRQVRRNESGHLIAPRPACRCGSFTVVEHGPYVEPAHYTLDPACRIEGTRPAPLTAPPLR